MSNDEESKGAGPEQAVARGGKGVTADDDQSTEAHALKVGGKAMPEDAGPEAASRYRGEEAGTAATGGIGRGKGAMVDDEESTEGHGIKRSAAIPDDAEPDSTIKGSF
jgi:hypothetical protein